MVRHKIAIQCVVLFSCVRKWFASRIFTVKFSSDFLVDQINDSFESSKYFYANAIVKIIRNNCVTIKIHVINEQKISTHDYKQPNMTSRLIKRYINSIKAYFVDSRLWIHFNCINVRMLWVKYTNHSAW